MNFFGWLAPRGAALCHRHQAYRSRLHCWQACRHTLSKRTLYACEEVHLRGAKAHRMCLNSTNSSRVEQEPGTAGPCAALVALKVPERLALRARRWAPPFAHRARKRRAELEHWWHAIFAGGLNPNFYFECKIHTRNCGVALSIFVCRILARQTQATCVCYQSFWGLARVAARASHARTCSPCARSCPCVRPPFCISSSSAWHAYARAPWRLI